jgi:hypothetical protein
MHPARLAGLAVLLLAVVAIQAGLWTSGYTDDDFEDILAVRNSTVFTGRSGFWNYNPVMGVLWLPARSANLDAVAIYLRGLNTLIQMVSPLALLLFLRRLGAGWGMAWGSAFLFVLHPLAFEGGLRLCNMHYTLSLMFMLLALYFAAGWLERPGASGAVLAVGCELLSLFSSFLGISVVPALMALHLFKDSRLSRFSIRWPWLAVRRTLIWTAPAVLYLILFLVVMASANITPGKKYEQSLGMFIVYHLWMFYALLAWDPGLGVNTYIQLSSMKIFNLPLVAWGVCGVLLLAGAVAAWRQRRARPWIAFAFLILVVTALAPPKPHFMPRWCYFSIPWIAVLQAALLGGAWQQARNRLGAWSRVAAALVIALLVGSSARWYAFQIGNLRFCADVNRKLAKAAQGSAPGVPLVVLNMPQGRGFDQPWPRQTYFTDYQLRLSLELSGIPADPVEVHWLDRATDPRHPPEPVLPATTVPVHARLLAWNGQDFQDISPLRAGR